MPGPTAFKKLRELPYFDDVEALIRKGESPEDVAKWIQEAKGGRTDVKRDSLIRQLYRFRDQLPAGQLEALKKPARVQEKLEEYANEVDELAMLSKLWYIQMERIEIGRNVENTTKFLSKGMYREIEQAKDILVKIGELKIKLGHYEGAATDRVTVSGHMGVVERVREYGEAEREKLGHIFDRFMRAAMDSGQDLRALPPGDIVDADWEPSEKAEPLELPA